jgi:5,10-methylene-tetrahydrofolate dehydrogenase/methenyl tetrahydrofolate cyclohydrolase
LAKSFRELVDKSDLILSIFALNICLPQAFSKMEIIVTGSLGHIGKPLIKELIQKGHSVTIISSKVNRKK